MPNRDNELMPFFIAENVDENVEARLVDVCNLYIELTSIYDNESKDNLYTEIGEKVYIPAKEKKENLCFWSRDFTTFIKEYNNVIFWNSRYLLPRIVLPDLLKKCQSNLLQEEKMTRNLLQHVNEMRTKWSDEMYKKKQVEKREEIMCNLQNNNYDMETNTTNSKPKKRKFQLETKTV